MEYRPPSIGEQYPDLDFYQIRGLLTTPPMYELRHLSNGQYSLMDLHILHEVMDLKAQLAPVEEP